MQEVELKAYAKINLSLEVTGRRPDGYHEIRSLMQGIDLYDVIKITKCAGNGTKYNFPHCIIDGIVVYLCTDAKTIPTDMSNLAFKGIKAVLDRLLAGDSKAEEYALIVEIHKLLPVAAGIAGGSGNAAVCMLGLNAIEGYPLTLRELMDAGAKVGADVPFSLLMNAYRNADKLGQLRGIDEASSAAWMAGIGDIVDPAEPVRYDVIMANPGIAVSTKDAYEAIDSIRGISLIQPDAQNQDPKVADRKLFVNDLELYTLSEYPEAAELKSVMENELNADIVLMSGSGPTMAAYYTDAVQAHADFAGMCDIADRHEGWRVWKTRTGF